MASSSSAPNLFSKRDGGISATLIKSNVSYAAAQASTGEHEKMITRVPPRPPKETNDLLSTLIRQVSKHIKSEKAEKSPLTPEATVFLEVFLVAGCIWTFVKLAGMIRKGGTDEIDNEMLLALRRPENTAIPIGPSWLPEMARDVTALGSGVDLTLASTTLVGYLCLNRRFRAAGYLIASVGSGLLLCRLLKDLFVRRRPTAVAALTHFDPESFPSGHSMGSAVVYLTLGGIISRQFRGWVTKVYLLSVALIITLLVGLSRIYLGVHYPSDVLAGWAAGSLWSSACTQAARWLQRQGAVEPPASPALPEGME